ATSSLMCAYFYSPVIKIKLEVLYFKIWCRLMFPFLQPPSIIIIIIIMNKFVLGHVACTSKLLKCRIIKKYLLRYLMYLLVMLQKNLTGFEPQDFQFYGCALPTDVLNIIFNDPITYKSIEPIKFASLLKAGKFSNFFTSAGNRGPSQLLTRDLNAERLMRQFV
ncbi:hypothetical protein L9F63_019016, partial [Diploptera punctata]